MLIHECNLQKVDVVKQTASRYLLLGIWVCPDCARLNAIDNRRCLHCDSEKLFTVMYLSSKI